jgi:hypothetical protein
MLITFLIGAIVAAAGFLALAWKTMNDERRRSEARVAALAAAIDEAGESAVATGPEPLFDSGSRSAMQGRPLLKVAIGFAMAVGLIVLLAMTSDRHDVATAQAPAAPPASSGLELLSMRHTRAGDVLTVTGLVRNGGDAIGDRLIAVVLAFDRRGDFVASGRAPLEFPVLARADESPFQVTIPNIDDVGRYRVSFRTEAGVVRHVDRRAGQ